MEDLQVTGNDDVPGEVLKLFGEDGHKLYDTTDQQHTLHWRMAEGFHWSYNYYLKKEIIATKCSNHCTFSTLTHTAKMVTRNLKEGLKGKLRIYLDKVSLVWEEEKNWGCNSDANSNIKINCGHRYRIACILHSLAEHIWWCKLDQINTDPKVNCF